MLGSHRRHGQEKTVLFCFCRQCEQNWRQVNTEGDRKFRNCFVQSRNAVRTNENSLYLSPILFTPSTRQSKTVLFCPRGWCELVWTRSLSQFRLNWLFIESMLVRKWYLGLLFINTLFLYVFCRCHKFQDLEHGGASQPLGTPLLPPLDGRPFKSS